MCTFNLAPSSVLVAMLVLTSPTWAQFRQYPSGAGGLWPKESRGKGVLFFVPTHGAWSASVATILLPIIVGRAFRTSSEGSVDPIAKFSGIV